MKRIDMILMVLLTVLVLAAIFGIPVLMDAWP
jgi:hypothetical protein